MAVSIKKYNPGFLSDDEVVASFCVRNAEFKLLLESLQSSTGNSGVHSMVIGPRGSGKTHLLLRVAAEVRRDPSLSGFYPIVFAEESYEVSTIGEFWLACLDHLAEQASEGERANLRLSYDDLRATGDDRALADRCLGTILDFADRHGKRVVLLVENLNMLFADMDDPDAGWRLRHTLQTEPRIVLLGSATSRFDEIDHPDHALYDLFRVITLRPLDAQECVALWEAVSGQPSTTLAVRPLEILTGGNPRLLAIIALFSAGRSFGELKANLLDLVDDHTEYFKSHLESLPALERRVYLSLARLWKPATAREVADQSRTDVNKCSALLMRLMERGAVAVVGGTLRRRQYYLTERLYNIYYLLRRDSGSSQAVEALIDFMVCLYSPADLWDVVADIYRETRHPTSDVRELVAQELINKAHLLADIGHEDGAIAIFEQVTDRLRMSKAAGHQNQAAVASLNKVLRLNLAGRYDEGVRACEQMLASFETSREPSIVAAVAIALDSKGRAWDELGNPSEAVYAYEQALDRFATAQMWDLSQLVADTMLRKGSALVQNGNPSEAVVAFDAVVAKFASADETSLVMQVATALLSKAAALLLQGKTITESDFSLLLDCVSKEEDLRPGLIQVLTILAVTSGLARTLKLIQASPAADSLLPLVAALQQELGQETHVAKEVDEVAADIRGNIVELAANIPSEVPTWIAEFLRDEVNLNRIRLDRLETSAGAVNDYLKGNLAGYQKMERLGSYALGTLIKPVDDNDEYDADIQIVMNPNPKWEAKDYVLAINRTLAGNKTYANQLTLKARCVTVDYSGDFHLDVVPRVTIDGKHYICNRHDNKFEETDGTGYRDWFNEKDRITGGNLKQVVRLLKYLRDHKNSFTAKSILLTTLAGNAITSSDEGTAAVNTVVGTLDTVLSRMNEYLQQHPNMPDIKNPVLSTENFNRHWDQRRYANFRNRIQSYARTAKQARAEPLAENAIEPWRHLLGESFGKSVNSGEGSGQSDGGGAGTPLTRDETQRSDRAFAGSMPTGRRLR